MVRASYNLKLNKHSKHFQVVSYGITVPMYRVFINDSNKGVPGHNGFKKLRFAEIRSHYDSSRLSLMSFVTCYLKSSFLLFERFSSVNYSNSR